MLTVVVYVNDHIAFCRNARRQEAINPEGVNTYRTDSGEIIEHKYADGLIPLAKKILDTVKEDY